jgi:hypothetical protein
MHTHDMDIVSVSVYDYIASDLMTMCPLRRNHDLCIVIAPNLS